MLLVIDMQPGFKTSLQVKSKVQEEVAIAASRGEEIIFLEYTRRWKGDTLFGKRYSQTHKEIRDAARGAKTIRCLKQQDDGSKVVFRHLKGLSKIRVCGVNGDACVAATINGIARRFPRMRIELLSNAIGWNVGCEESKFASRSFRLEETRRHPNVVVV